MVAEVQILSPRPAVAVNVTAFFFALPYRQTLQHRAEPGVTHLGTHKCQGNPHTQQSTNYPEGEHQCPTIYTDNLIPETDTEKREAVIAVGDRLNGRERAGLGGVARDVAQPVSEVLHQLL